MLALISSSTYYKYLIAWGIFNAYLPIISLCINPDNEIAHVRIGNELCAAERSYQIKRKEIVRQTLNSMLQTKIESDYVPIIALACSGGGYRAMLYSMGAIVGAEKIGLLDSIMYLVGLSGSTWSIGGWLCSDKSATDYLQWLIPATENGILPFGFENALLLGEVILGKEYYSQPLGLVDLYGGLLTGALFKDKGVLKYKVKLSDQCQRLENALVPFPLYTAMRADKPDHDSETMWYEFTPYEIGAYWLNAYIPSWAYGRQFKNGMSIDFASEMSFGTELATFGLAIGGTVAKMIKSLNLEEQFYFSFSKKIVKKIIKSSLGSARLCAAEINNFTLGMEHSQVKDQDILLLADAGLSCNLPYQPISGQRPERTADIIIFMDASAGNIGSEMHCVQDYAQKHQLAFPAIDYTAIATSAVNIFKDETNPQAPVVIYIPRITDQNFFMHFMQYPEYAPLIAQLDMFNVEQCMQSGSCNTFNFEYTFEDARRLSLLGELNFSFAFHAIMDAVRLKIRQHTIE